MIAGALRNQIDQRWEKFWTGVINCADNAKKTRDNYPDAAGYRLSAYHCLTIDDPDEYRLF